MRRLHARRRFKELKREARSVEHVKKLNKGLENKIISLQQKLGEVVCLFLMSTSKHFLMNSLFSSMLIKKA